MPRMFPPAPSHPFHPNWKWAKRVDPPVEPPTYAEFWTKAVARSEQRLRDLRDDLKRERAHLKHAQEMAARPPRQEESPG